MWEERGGIRRATVDDAAEIARLCGLLGYPASPATVAARLDELLAHPDTLLVVYGVEGGLLGWMEVAHRLSLELGHRAEILALVVNDAARGRGVGRQLVNHGERWARERGLAAIMVRSNAARSGAHEFYAALGYRRLKTQHVYARELRPASGD